jgi:outer membrane protein TolC
VELEPLDVYYSSALSRPDILAAETRQKETEDGIEFARSSYYPEVGVGGEYQWNDHRSPISGEGQSYIVNAFLRWSIFDGARREHQVKKAKARAAEAGEYLQGMKKEARFRVYESYEAVQEAQKSLQSAKSELDSAREGMRLVRIRYENALAPVVDLLDSEAMLEKARARLIEAENGVLDKFSKLCFESGRSDEFVQEVAEKSMDKEQ